MLRAISNQRGSAILIALALIGMLSILGIMAAKNSNTDIDLSFNQAHFDGAFYLADAGAKRAINELSADSDWRDGFHAEPFGEGFYTVTVVDTASDSTLADTVIVRATGLLDGAVSIVEYELVPDVFNPFAHAMFGDDGIEIKNGFATDSYNSDSGSYAATRDTLGGDVGSNKSVDMKNGSYVGGSVSNATSGGNSIHPGATVTGDTSDSHPEVNLPIVPQSEFDAAEISSVAGDSISGNYSYNSSTKTFQTTKTCTFASGTYYFSSMILKNSAEIIIAPGADVTIYITGDIEMKNSASLNAGGDPDACQIYSQGDFVLKNSGGMVCTFYNPEGSADLRNSGDFYGSIIANDIICHNSANFHYDRNLGNITMGGAGSLAVVAFREVDE